MVLLEVCVDSTECAIIAEKGGAGRLELCSVLELGGLTPSIGLLIEVKKHVSIPVFCMLRCRPGDFCYNTTEISTMLEDAKKLIEHGADGVVFGFLTQSRMIDIDSCKTMMQNLPKGFPCTFHRAFDFIHTPENAVQTLKDLGFSRILTTGGGSDVSSSIDTLKELYTAGVTGSITILPGGGVNESNVICLKEIGFREVHSSCSIYCEDAEYGSLFNKPLPSGQRKTVCPLKVERLCMILQTNE